MTRTRTASRPFEAGRTVDELHQQLASEIRAAELAIAAGDTLTINEDSSVGGPKPNADGGFYENAEKDALIAEANAFLTALDKDNGIACAGTDDASEVKKECDDLEKEISKKENENVQKKETAAVLASCDELERRITAAEKGIEKKIGDTARGISSVVLDTRKNTVATGTRKGVFGKGSRSQYVASITARLDRVADILEKRGQKRMAFRIDRLSDAIEKQANI